MTQAHDPSLEESQGIISHFCGTAIGVVALASVFIGLNGTETPLVVSTAALALVIFLFWGGAYLWDKLAAADERAAQPQNQGAPQPQVPAGEQPSLGQAVNSGVQLAITIQGVVLGLIFSFVSAGEITATVKVAVISLIVGVIAGLLVIAISSIEIPGPRTHTFVILLVYISLWGLAYGLLCIGSTVTAR
ncbi:hypothetical protein [Streptomyces sp. NPDC006446]|uniref:hypothetical protein n=1 Tax=Streptomyces sp. NPDC006446 TaxID=3154301 RepID=UPI0033A853AA